MKSATTTTKTKGARSWPESTRNPTQWDTSIWLPRQCC